MALPHMPATYTARRNFYETTVLSRRNKEIQLRETWNQHANYFHVNDAEANQKQAWESRASFQNSMEAYKIGTQRDAKATALKDRREKLAKMLAEERAEFQTELQQLSREERLTLGDMVEQVGALRSAREKSRQQLADQKLYEHWRVNNPDIRRLESAQSSRQAVDKWSVQIEEQKKREEDEKLARLEQDKKIEEERLEAIEVQRRNAAEKAEQARRMKDSLEQQMAELKAREAESRQLKESEEMLMRERLDLARLEEQRKAQETGRQREEMGRILLRQHASALRRRSQLIQKELEQDRKLLEQLAEQEERDQHIQSARREKARADAQWMKKVIDDQIKTEKTREAELDLLYQDEAARIWQQREAEWAREKQARERLMKEVMKGRQEQIDGKMEEVHRRQADSMQQRAELLEELEIVNQLSHRDAKMRDAEKLEQRRQLESQITSRKEKEQDTRMQLHLELDEEERADKDYEELLKQEAERITVRGYQPPPRTKKQAWM